MGSEETRRDGHVKTGVQYVWRNNFTNYVQYSLPLVLLFLCALLLTVVGLMCIVISCVLLYYVCIAVLYTSVPGLLARYQYPEGPATGHLNTDVPGFPLPVYNLR